MNNDIEQKAKRPEYIDELYQNSKPLTVQEYKGNADCITYITTEKAIQICEKYLKSETAKAVGVDALVMPKIAEVIENKKQKILSSLNEYLAEANPSPEREEVLNTIADNEIKICDELLAELSSNFSA